MIRYFPDIPNVAFHKIVRQYALSRHKKYFTLDHQHCALINYVSIAQFLN